MHQLLRYEESFRATLHTSSISVRAILGQCEDHIYYNGTLILAFPSSFCFAETLDLASSLNLLGPSRRMVLHCCMLYNSLDLHRTFCFLLLKAFLMSRIPLGELQSQRTWVSWLDSVSSYCTNASRNSPTIDPPTTNIGTFMTQKNSFQLNLVSKIHCLLSSEVPQV